MKRFGNLLLLALLPWVSGCFTLVAIDAAKEHTVETSFFSAADKISKAGITKDNQLCVCFEKVSTNPAPERFELTFPIEKIWTDVPTDQVKLTRESKPSSTTNSYPFFESMEQNKKYTNFWLCGVTTGALEIPASAIRTNWESHSNTKTGLKSFPIGTTTSRDWNDRVRQRQSPTLLSNADETIYLTDSQPIQFIYLDRSIPRTMTTVTVKPLLRSKTRVDHPAYYLLLPVTIPADIGTLPLQPIFLMFLALRQLGSNC